MQVNRFIVNMQKKDDQYHLMPLGDIHFGSVAHDRENFLAHVKKILESPNHFTIGIGDNFENMNADNDRSLATFDIENVIKSTAPTLEDEIAQFVPIFKPLAQPTPIFPNSKLMGMHLGNHEDRTLKHKGFDLYVCKPLGARYLGDFAFTVIWFIHNKKPVHKYTVLSAHGTNFGGQSLGTVLQSAHRKFTAYAFDVALFGHTHFAGIEKFYTGYIQDSGNDEAPTYLQAKRLIANTGAFVRSHMEGADLYTDKMFGSLRNKGTVTITFDPYKQEIFGHV